MVSEQTLFETVKETFSQVSQERPAYVALETQTREEMEIARRMLIMWARARGITLVIDQRDTLMFNTDRIETVQFKLVVRDELYGDRYEMTYHGFTGERVNLTVLSKFICGECHEKFEITRHEDRFCPRCSEKENLIWLGGVK